MHSRLKQLLMAAALTVTAIIGSLVAVPAAQAAPAGLVLVPREVPAQAPQNAMAPALVGEKAYNVFFDGIYRGFVWIRVYSDHAKRLVVCDELGDHREPTLQVDPTPGEPIEYQDPNGSTDADCGGYTIGYPVQKFRIGFHEEGNATVALGWGPWFNTPPEGPLPYAGF